VLNHDFMTKWYIGIDPGKSGGISAISNTGLKENYRTPKIGNDMDLKECRRILSKYPNANVALENVRSLPGVSAKANFSFGENKGQWQGIIEGLDLPYMMIMPKAWQKIAWEGVTLVKKANKKTDTKKTSLIAVTRLIPGESFLATDRSSVPHDGIIDARLIAFALKCKLAGK